MKFIVLNYIKLRRAIANIIWDVDGVITLVGSKVVQTVGGKSKLLPAIVQAVMAKILNLAANGIRHNFVTGRDAQWIIDNLIKPLKEFNLFTSVYENLAFFAEVGCVILQVNAEGKITKEFHPLIVDHPLKANHPGKSGKGIRDTFRELAYDPATLEPYNGRTLTEDEEVIYDACDPIPNGFVINRKTTPVPLCWAYIWSPYKDAFATLESVRNQSGQLMHDLTRDQCSDFNKHIVDAIKAEGFENDIATEIIATAINIVPIVDGVQLGKAWAAGRAIEHVYNRVNIAGQEASHHDLQNIIHRTLCFGDGRADFDFTIPLVNSIVPLAQPNPYICFVGGEQDLPPETDPRLDNLVIRAAPGYKGADVVSEILDFLQIWQYFHRF